MSIQTEIERAPIEGKTLFMRKMISKIDVDRDNNVVRFYIRKLPAITPELDEMVEIERVVADVATTQRSGSRNIELFTNLDRLRLS